MYQQYILPTKTKENIVLKFSKSRVLVSIMCPAVSQDSCICLRREKTCLRGFANNKAADQPVHPRRLTKSFVICLLENIISKLASSEISIFQLLSVDEHAVLSMTWSETPTRRGPL